MPENSSRLTSVTIGREKIAIGRFKAIRDAIKAAVPDKDKYEEVIQQFTGVSSRSFNNYFSGGEKKAGKVSKGTVENMAKFSGLPESVFDCSGDYGDEEQNVILNAIMERLEKPVSSPKQKKQTAKPARKPKAATEKVKTEPAYEEVTPAQTAPDEPPAEAPVKENVNEEAPPAVVIAEVAPVAVIMEAAPTLAARLADIANAADDLPDGELEDALLYTKLIALRLEKRKAEIEILAKIKK